MIRQTTRYFVALLGISLAMPALAVNVTVSGKLRATGPQMSWIGDLDFCTDATTSYTLVGPVTTDVGGTYEVRDSGATTFSADTVLSFYQGMPDLNNLAANRVAIDDAYGLESAIDDIGSVSLQANTNYYILAQPYCAINFNGVWGQHISGPGTLQGPQAATTPSHWQGEWTANDPTANTTLNGNCPDTYYDVSGPHQVAKSGTHYVSVTSGFDEQFIFFSVYEDAFDADHPATNQVFGDEGGAMELEAGTDYYFVTQPFCDVYTGPWYYVMWNPAPFELNSASAGAYYDLLTSGQGQLVSINQNNVVYVAWFTYDSAPAVGVPRPQAVGIPGQRWLTMLGTYQSGDTSVDLNVYAPNAVGVFNQPPVVGVDPVGTAVMDMESCTSGELRYTLDTGEAGTAVMGLLVGDNDQCEANYAGPAVLYE